MGKSLVLKNAVLITLAGIIAKTIDFSFRAWYSGLLKEEGMGIFSLVMSVFGIVLGLSSAGMGAAVSRLVSIHGSRGNFSTAHKIVKTAVIAVAAAGLLCTALIAAAADKIALVWLKDIRCAKCLVYIAPSAIFMGISYCIKGYFYAMRNVLIPASSEFVEQAVKISVITVLVKEWLPKGVEYGCAGVFAGLTVGEMCSCLYLCLWYAAKSRGLSGGNLAERPLLSILGLSAPMAISSVAGSLFRMLEDIWIVRGFKKFGMGSEGALSSYGLIHGMAMPLLVFPLTLISSFMALLIPEISKAETSGSLRRITSRVHGVAWFFGMMIFCIFFIFPEEISVAVYKSPAAAEYIRPLSVLCPIMIIDTVSNGMLSGMGEQMKLLKYSMADSALRLFMVYFMLPKLGAPAIVAMIFLSNILTCFLTVRRSRQKSGGSGLWQTAITSAIGAGITIVAVSAIKTGGMTEAVLCGFIVLTAAIYALSGIVLRNRGKLCSWKFRL